MIVAEQKPLEEVRKMVEPYDRVLILGCGTCVAVCFAGGDKEVGVLAASLRLADKMSGRERLFSEHTVERQCEWEFVDGIEEKVKNADAVLSLGCGVGVQAISERFPEIPVIPGLNTLFMGMPVEEGVWAERCAGCGNCILDKTGGICPIARCSKGLVNGPCGGYRDGKCEVDPTRDCAWVLIYERLKKMGRLDELCILQPLKDYSKMSHPRSITL
ncbi:MAG: methylenetetrahydrofolate reductase C-terminal domain-containing protein [Dehalococcoidia bacterium]|nr:methylenetetrahydrofolate reductase C-terminal domain-containing protein [Dehalococcoidia bacterium]